VAHPDAWAGTVLFYPEVREAMEHLLAWGLVDLVRQHHPEGGLYSWWDYRMLGLSEERWPADRLHPGHGAGGELLHGCRDRPGGAEG